MPGSHLPPTDSLSMHDQQPNPPAPTVTAEQREFARVLGQVLAALWASNQDDHGNSSSHPTTPR